MALCLLVLLGRVFYLQILQAPYFESRARSQQQRTLKLKPQRSKIYDRNSKILAVSVPVDSLYANPRSITSPYTVASRLASRLKIPRKDLLKTLRNKRSFTWLKRQLKPDVVQAIKTLNLEGIGFIKEYRRYYPLGNLAGAVLGFTGLDSRGLEGIEYRYQSILEGKARSYVVEKDGIRRIVPEGSIQSPDDSQYDLHLTLDAKVQYFAENALKKGLERSRSEHGVALVMRTNTGEVLAMASSPGFDPNRYKMTDRANYLNRAVTLGYEPGSTLKPITIAAALEEKLIKPDQVLFCEHGEFLIGDKIIHDTSPHDNMTIEEILQKSSNICAAKIGMMLSPEQLYDYLRKFGLGKRTRIGLSGETNGHILKPNRWTSVDHASISFGHGIFVSPIQLITAINTIATGGMRVQPYLVDYGIDVSGKKVLDIKNAEGKIKASFGPGTSKRVISEETALTLRHHMMSVTQPGGTAFRAAIKGYEVSGKTGTSQVFDPQIRRYSRSKHIALFAGFLPALHPVFTILVVLELPKTSPYAGVVAAPVFKEIAKRLLLQEKVPPEPYFVPPGSAKAKAPNSSARH